MGKDARIRRERRLANAKGFRDYWAEKFEGLEMARHQAEVIRDEIVPALREGKILVVGDPKEKKP